MIQRIQTIWLILIIILLIAVIYISIVRFFSLFGISLIIVNGLTGITAAVTIFLYRNRSLQIKICYLILIPLSLSFLALLLFGLNWTSIFPAIAILADTRAIRSIKKDEKLIRSLNRLR